MLKSRLLRRQNRKSRLRKRNLKQRRRRLLNLQRKHRQLPKKQRRRLRKKRKTNRQRKKKIPVSEMAESSGTSAHLPQEFRPRARLLRETAVQEELREEIRDSREPVQAHRTVQDREEHPVRHRDEMPGLQEEENASPRSATGQETIRGR